MHFKTFFSLQFRRHMHNPVLWLIGLAAPIAAHYMVPAEGSTYTVVSINGAFPILTSSVIGLELGIIASLLLSPLAYIYLRANRTKIAPWQVEDATSASRIALSFGHWLADTLFLIFILFILACAGILLSLFRLELTQIRPLDTLYTLFMIAVPAFAMIAAVKAWFTARPWLRGSLGEFSFFFLWMLAIVMGAAFFETDANAFIDVFGYAASINYAVDVPIDAFAVGSSPVSGERSDMIAIDAIAGVSELEYVLSRAFWLLMAVAIAILSGVLFAPRQVKKISSHRYNAMLSKSNFLIRNVIMKLLPKNTSRLAFLSTEISEILTPKWVALLLVVISVMGVYLPFKEVVMPALWLILIFLYSEQSGRWQARSMKVYLSAMPTSANQQFVMALVSAVIFTFVLCLPSFFTIIFNQQYSLITDLILLSTFVPFVIYSLGRITGSGTSARLIMLVAWYMYLNI